MISDTDELPAQPSLLSMFLLNTNKQASENLEFVYVDQEGKSYVNISYLLPSKRFRIVYRLFLVISERAKVYYTKIRPTFWILKTYQIEPMVELRSWKEFEYEI